MSETKEIIRNEDGEEVNIESDFELAKLILEITRNKPLLSMLFGYELTEEVSAGGLAELLGDYQIIQAIKSIISTAFLVAISRWKQLCDNKDDWTDADTADAYDLLISSRYSKLFQSALNCEEITADLQIFALTELWVSLKNPKCGMIEDEFDFFAGHKEGETIGITLQQALDFIKNATFLGTNNEGKYSKYNCNLICIKLLRIFPFFEDLEVELPKYNTESDDPSEIFRLNDPKDFLFSYKVGKKRIKLYPNKLLESYGKIVVTGAQLAALKGEKANTRALTVSPHMLAGISDFNGEPHYTYRSFDGETETDVVPRVSPKESKAVKKAEKQDASIIKKFLSFNYKNIRQFALIISDAIQNTELPQELLEKFVKSYKKNSQVFNAIKFNTADEVYLDYIITLMLVEMGPSDFLEQILSSDAVYNNIMDNIGWRCIGRKERTDYEKTFQSDLENIRKQYPRNNKQFERLRLELKVSNVVKAMGFFREVDTDTFEESLSSKYENINEYIKTLKEYKLHPDDVKKDDRDNSKKGLREIFKDMFIFMNIFYTGLNAYAETKRDILNSGNTASSPENEEMDEDERNKARRRVCTDSFIRVAGKKYAEIKDRSLTEAFDDFCSLCKMYSGKNKLTENLKMLITRSYICNVSRLEYYAKIKCDDGEETTIFHMLENYSDKYYDDSHFSEWLDYFKDVFFFLIYNEDYYRRGLFKDEDAFVDKDCDPIYPYLVNYHRENTDKDNLKKCTYNVPVPVKNSVTDNLDKGFVVNLLTEEHYPPVPHFCIPLKYGSTDNWWINPFMIPKRIVKEIKKEAKNHEPHND